MATFKWESESSGTFPSTQLYWPITLNTRQPYLLLKAHIIKSYNERLLNVSFLPHTTIYSQTHYNTPQQWGGGVVGCWLVRSHIDLQNCT